MVANALEPLWPERARRIRQCGSAGVRMVHECGASSYFPYRCGARTCPTCAWMGAAPMAERLLERIRVHDVVMETEPWDGPGEPNRYPGRDPQGRGWKFVTLTSPAVKDEEARFDPDALRAQVLRVRGAVGAWWRKTGWGRQVRDPGTRSKRVRKDTSYIASIEVAPGGMVHVHMLVYGEFVLKAELAQAWGGVLGLDGPAVVDIRTVDPEDPARGIREALKYASKGEGDRDRQAARAAAVEFAFGGVRRVSVGGALRKIRGRSRDADSEDVQAEDLHDHHEAVCQACGMIGGRWKWDGIYPHYWVEANGGWGAVLPSPIPAPPP